MTQDEFKELLDEKEYSYYEEDGWVIVDEKESEKCEDDGGIVLYRSGSVFLRSLKTIPENVLFRNSGHVYLQSLETIHYNTLVINKDKFYGKNVYFKNGKEIGRTDAEVIFD